MLVEISPRAFFVERNKFRLNSIKITVDVGWVKTSFSEFATHHCFGAWQFAADGGSALAALKLALDPPYDPTHPTAFCQTYGRHWPSPRTQYLKLVNCSTPTGPRACIFAGCDSDLGTHAKLATVSVLR